MTHFAPVVTGTQTCPAAQPPPIIVAPQKRLVVAQVAAPGVAAPEGVQLPGLIVVANAPAWTP